MHYAWSQTTRPADDSSNIRPTPPLTPQPIQVVCNNVTTHFVGDSDQNSWHDERYIDYIVKLGTYGGTDRIYFADQFVTCPNNKIMMGFRIRAWGGGGNPEKVEHGTRIGYEVRCCDYFVLQKP